MLNNLSLEGVCPAQLLTIHFKPRLDFLTGADGVGKSFVLDIAGWALTPTWGRGGTAATRQDASETSIWRQTARMNASSPASVR